MANLTLDELRAKYPPEDREEYDRAYAAAALAGQLAELAYTLRTKAGLTQAELARRMGTTQSSIARIEGGGSTTTPGAAIAARRTGCVKALRRILGDRVDTPAFARAAELLIKAATSAPFEGRPMYAALRAAPIPDDVVARFFHAGSLAARAPWRRAHRGPDDRGCRRP